MRSRSLDAGRVPRRSQGPLTRKKETRLILSRIDQTSLVNQGFIILNKEIERQKMTFAFGTQRLIPSGQGNAILPITAQVLGHLARSHCKPYNKGGAGMAPPSNVARVQFRPGVICGLSLLLVLVLAPRVFLRVLRFSSLHKN